MPSSDFNNDVPHAAWSKATGDGQLGYLQIVFFPYPLKEFLRDIVVSLFQIATTASLADNETLTDMVPSIVEFALCLSLFQLPLHRRLSRQKYLSHPVLVTRLGLPLTHLSCVYAK